ncbi:phosphatidylinositol-binding protein scs2 [Arachnomyces sp. PD_36]|nr:phosphatidylinositol-binding protein scs2 [Arachnomyces sp. PD_36]
MSVEIDPSELGFRRPFTTEVSQTLRLQNNNDNDVVFKVKTTAPKQYCVRPNSGRIEAGRHVEVQVLLQAMKEDPPADAKCRDKFLVQSVSITQDQDFANVSSIWQNVEKTAKSSIQERKIRVVFLPAEEAQTPPPPSEQTNGIAPASDGAIYTSPVGKFDTPAAQQATPPTRSAQSSEETHTSSGATKSEILTPSTSAVDSKSGITALSSNDEAHAQLADAKAQIKKLQQTIASNELRQRKGGDKESRDSSGLQQQQQQPVESGVPLQTAAALCLLSFLIAYFFF